MAKLVFDIETVGEDFDGLDHATQEILTRAYQDSLEELKAGLGFSPLTGQIVAIGVLDCEKNKGVVYYQAPGAKEKESEAEGITFKPVTEKEMLEQFWAGAKNYNEFITFNGRAFDAPFLMIRSAVHGIKPTKDLMLNRYTNYQQSACRHIDLFDQLSFYGAMRKKGSLHLWSRAFGIKSPKADGVTGDDVGRLFKEKKFLDIARYNVGDLRATKALYEQWEKYLKF